jgi:DMSO/TMAO reductase YedYZ heme-binding membrane subunit
MNNHIWWYVARSGGIVAWVLLAISMFWGLALSSRFLGKRPKPNWMLDLHRFVGGLATVFTAAHVVGLMLDSYISFSLADVVVPFAGDYHPVAVAWGIIAMYFLLAVEVTSLLRKKLSKRAWQATHYLSFPLFGLSTAHLLWVGTDRATPALRITVVIGVVAVCAATAMRIVQADSAETAMKPRVPVR